MSLGKVISGGAGRKRPKALGNRSEAPSTLGQVGSPVCVRHRSSHWSGQAEDEVESDLFLGRAIDSGIPHCSFEE